MSSQRAELDWTTQDITAFFQEFQANGKNWNRIAERLPRRNPTVIQSLYLRHRKYLDLPVIHLETFQKMVQGARTSIANLNEFSESDDETSIKNSVIGQKRSRQPETRTCVTPDQIKRRALTDALELMVANPQHSIDDSAEHEERDDETRDEDVLFGALSALNSMAEVALTSPRLSRRARPRTEFSSYSEQPDRAQREASELLTDLIRSPRAGLTDNSADMDTSLSDPDIDNDSSHPYYTASGRTSRSPRRHDESASPTANLLKAVRKGSTARNSKNKNSRKNSPRSSRSGSKVNSVNNSPTLGSRGQRSSQRQKSAREREESEGDSSHDDFKDQNSGHSRRNGARVRRVVQGDKLSLRIKRSSIQTSMSLFEYTQSLNPSSNKNTNKKSKRNSAQDASMPPEMLSSLRNCAGSAKFRRWCYYEWFYSAVDRLYYAQNEFMECLSKLNLSHITSLKRKQWRVVRSQMGHPRRVSKAFLAQEREKLERYRTEVRALQCQQMIECSIISSADQCPPPLNLGQRVVCIHPSSHELENGYIENIIPSQPSHSQSHAQMQKQTPTCYRVRFDSPLLSSPGLVADTHIMPIGPPVSLMLDEFGMEVPAHHPHQFTSPQANHTVVTPARTRRGTVPPLLASGIDSSPAGTLNASRRRLGVTDLVPFPHGRGDLVLVLVLLRLLDRKKALVDYLQATNDVAEKLRGHVQTYGSQGLSGINTSTIGEGQSSLNSSIPPQKVINNVTSNTVPTPGNYQQEIKDVSQSQTNIPVTNSINSSTSVIMNPSLSSSSLSSNSSKASPINTSSTHSDVNSHAVNGGTDWVPRSFKQQSAWVIVQLEKTTNRLEQALMQLRVRCLKPSPLSQTNTPASVEVVSNSHSPQHLAKISSDCRSQASELVAVTRDELVRKGEISGSSVLCSEVGKQINTLLEDVTALLIILRHSQKDYRINSKYMNEALERLRPRDDTNNKHYTNLKANLETILTNFRSAGR